MERVKKYIEIVVHYFKSLNWKDPMVFILSVLLIFLTLGSLIGSVLSTIHTKNELKKRLMVVNRKVLKVS